MSLIPSALWRQRRTVGIGATLSQRPTLEPRASQWVSVKKVKLRLDEEDGEEGEGGPCGYGWVDDGEMDG